MFFWGSGHKSVRQKASGLVICTGCGQASDLSVEADYDYSHIYWVFKAVKNVRASVVCGKCGHVQGADGEKPGAFFQRFGVNPIPFMDRRGGVVLLLLILGAGTYFYMSQAGRDVTGSIQRAGQLDAFDLRVGDCFDDETGEIAASMTEVFSVPAVPCGEPHDNEVFAVFDVDLASFPEQEVLDDMAFDGCLEHFEPFVGLDYQSSALEVTTLTPTYKSWHDSGDREVVCVLYHMEGEALKGTTRGSRL